MEPTTFMFRVIPNITNHKKLSILAKLRIPWIHPENFQPKNTQCQTTGVWVDINPQLATYLLNLLQRREGLSVYIKSINFKVGDPQASGDDDGLFSWIPHGNRMGGCQYIYRVPWKVDFVVVNFVGKYIYILYCIYIYTTSTVHGSDGLGSGWHWVCGPLWWNHDMTIGRPKKHRAKIPPIYEWNLENQLA